MRRRPGAGSGRLPRQPSRPERRDGRGAHPCVGADRIGPVPPGGGARADRRGAHLRPGSRRRHPDASRDRAAKVLVIGSGPIVIGQAAEFDYAGVQACLALREEGVGHVLVNSNPATVMTDPDVGGTVLSARSSVATWKRVIEEHRPDALLPTLGGQTGLNLAVALDDAGVLDRYGVRVLGTPLAAVRAAEDRGGFRTLVTGIGEPVPETAVVESVDDGLRFVEHAQRADRRAAGLHARRRGRWLRDGRGRGARAHRRTGWPRARSARCWSSAACWAGTRSSSRSCATRRTRRSPSAAWRTWTRWASTPATRSSSRRSRRCPTRSSSGCGAAR